jgi:transposase
VGPQEVRPCPKRKRYTTAYKLRILEEASRCVAPGELAAMIRREGIYSSTIADFRKQKARGELDAGGSVKASSPQMDAETLRKVGLLERENRKLRRDLARANVLLELQKKVSEILQIELQEE